MFYRMWLQCNELPKSLNRIVRWMDLKLVVGDRFLPERVTVTLQSLPWSVCGFLNIRISGILKHATYATPLFIFVEILLLPRVMNLEVVAFLICYDFLSFLSLAWKTFCSFKFGLHSLKDSATSCRFSIPGIG